MKIAAAVALSLGFGMTAPTMAETSGGVITFNGVVSDATCTVQGGSGSDGAANNFSVTLASAKSSELDAAAKTAHRKAFDVLIGGPGQTTCIATAADMYFEPYSSNIDAATGNLRNALGANGAGNVQVQLLKADDSVIDLRLPQAGKQSSTFTDNTARLTYKAQYVATAAATPGQIQTNVVYTVVYN
ncbi:fimbrial protein [Dyella sp.]|uniref:fimbrial protein n=1 Tax=Dyella sp. TaxID=1869338 RepID=UPI002ED37B51